MKVSVMQVIISVSQLIGSVMGLSTTRFQESLAIVNNYANSDKSIQVRLVDWVGWFLPTPHPSLSAHPSPCLPEYHDAVLHLYSFFVVAVCAVDRICFLKA